MRLIDADAFKKNMDYVCSAGGWLEPVTSAVTEYIKKHIDAQPTVNATEVVKCRDCKYRYTDYSDGHKYEFCGVWAGDTALDAFCSFGKKKE